MTQNIEQGSFLFFYFYTFATVIWLIFISVVFGLNPHPGIKFQIFLLEAEWLNGYDVYFLIMQTWFDSQHGLLKRMVYCIWSWDSGSNV